jgi:hypothetical protein
MSPATAGYGNPLYAESLAEFGEVRRLPRSGGALIVRDIPGTDLRDAVGPYPLFACEDPRGLAADLSALGGVVSAVLVPDPLGGFTPDLLRAAFPDLCVPYKTHFLADLTVAEEARVAKGHRRHLRRAGSALAVEHAERPADWLDQWCGLYLSLTERHGVRGMAEFSRAAFATQLRTPGVRAFRARAGGDTVAMELWFAVGGVAYYHLGASSAEGYRLSAAYAVMHGALAHFAAEGLRVAELGGAAGLADDPSDGLARFKRGWSTSTTTSYLCGRVTDRANYDRLTVAVGGPGDGAYFPAYRRPGAVPADTRSAP